MTGFVPSGYAALGTLREQMGADRLGADLAGGRLQAYRQNPWGELFPLSPSLWRGPDAVEMMAAGHLPKRRGLLNAGEVILVKLKTARPLRGESGANAAPAAWWPRAGQTLTDWANSEPAEDEARRRIKASVQLASEAKIVAELEAMWASAGGEVGEGSIGKLRRRRREH